MQMTPGGVYAAIRDQRLPAHRDKHGRVTVRRRDAEQFLRAKLAWLDKTARFARGELTEDEWLQRMWDNDPD